MTHHNSIGDVANLIRVQSLEIVLSCWSHCPRSVCPSWLERTDSQLSHTYYESHISYVFDMGISKRQDNIQCSVPWLLCEVVWICSIPSKTLKCIPSEYTGKSKPFKIYTLVNQQLAIENGLIQIVDWIYESKMVFFHSYVNVYQRVNVSHHKPEGKHIPS